MEAARHGVRLAESGEGVAIADVWLRSRHGATGIPAPVHTDEEVQAWVRGVLLPSCEVWVATEGEDLAGMMVLSGEWIEQLYVSPETSGVVTGRGCSAWPRPSATRSRSGRSRPTWSREASMRHMASSRPALPAR